MKKYEMMAIIANNLDEKEAKTAADESLKKRITSFDGKITFEDFWGAKGFAYKIEGEKWGYYVVYQFEIDGTNLIKLERELNIDKNIVRFLVTKVEKDMPAPIKYSEMKENSAKTEEVTETPITTESKEKKTVAPKITEKKEAVKTVKKDDVDKKLDEILDDASLGL